MELTFQKLKIKGIIRIDIYIAYECENRQIPTFQVSVNRSNITKIGSDFTYKIYTRSIPVANDAYEFSSHLFFWDHNSKNIITKFENKKSSLSTVSSRSRLSISTFRFVKVGAILLPDKMFVENDKKKHHCKINTSLSLRSKSKNKKKKKEIPFLSSINVRLSRAFARPNRFLTHLHNQIYSHSFAITSTYAE